MKGIKKKNDRSKLYKLYSIKFVITTTWSIFEDYDYMISLIKVHIIINKNRLIKYYYNVFVS